MFLIAEWARWWLLRLKGGWILANGPIQISDTRMGPLVVTEMYKGLEISRWAYSHQPGEANLRFAFYGSWTGQIEVWSSSVSSKKDLHSTM
jgi:hypothetical protein